MQNIVVNRKVLASILAIGLLAFWTHGTYSQPDETSSSKTSSLKSAADIRIETLPSVVYISTEESAGSGVLVQLQPRVVLTNAHVTKELDNVTVFFPAYNLKGALIQEREFYEEQKHRDLLKVLSYVTNGRVIATDIESDVAIVILEGVPATAKPIQSDEHYDYSRMKEGEPVHILGNPGNRPFLWQWDPGHFQKHDGARLTIAASVFYGNSGGPVVNQSGTLIGLASATDFETETYAVPLKPIFDLAGKVKPLRIFSITNNTEYTMDYEIKWSESGNWIKFSLEPASEPKIHQTEVDLFQNYPKIRYKYATNSENNKIPKDSTEASADKTPSEDTVTTTKHVHALQANFRYFGSNFMERIKIEDSYQYRFDYDSHKKQIELREPKEAVYIANNAGREMVYFLQRTRRSKEEKQTLQSGEVRLHLLDKPPTEEIIYNYPRIRFNNMVPTDVINEATDTTTRYRYSTDQKLQTARQFFNIDRKEDTIDVTDVKTVGNYYHFGLKRQLESTGLIDLYLGSPKPAVSRSKGWNILGRSITWAELIIGIALAIVLIIGFKTIDKKGFPKKPIFSLQNNTEVNVDYQVKWKENEDWSPIDPLEPGDDSIEWHDGSPEEIPSGYPKVRFDSIVDGKKETKEQTLETYIRRFGPKTEDKIDREDTRQYHFERDPETQHLNLVDSEKSD